jgi:hypothetical protein
MKLSRTFLTGILAFALAFGMTLAGCDNGTTNGDDDKGGNPLSGSWVNERANPRTVIIFTDMADAAVAGAKVAYCSVNLAPEQTSATGTQVTIGGYGYTYGLGANVLTVHGYGQADAAGNRPDVQFDRAKGTSGSTMHGIWVSRLANNNPYYTLLIIRTGTAAIYTSVGSDNWGEYPYTPSADANATYVKWGSGNPMVYTKTSNPDQLLIAPPVVAGARQETLITLSSSW